MIYFQTNKKDRGLDFIDINIPNNLVQLNAYYNTRNAIFCKEQGIFEDSDYDTHDQKAIPIIAVNHYLGSPDEVVGVVRIYEDKHREWFGGRLGVVKEHRSFSKFICPNLFKKEEVSPLYQMSIAASLIYRAVSLANYIGCDKFSAYVQKQNVKLFQRLYWNCIEEVQIHGVTHFLMEADLDAYPATPIFGASLENTASLSELLKIA
ncbi:MSMEG_0567/Sll0786 family nitrogen starvation N-acetyltransferase [Zobellia roscoffensis]|uniref:MSMEG_0567/Sll0786 family nitrogen starvation N-acetyltransferase n=1 Tax=Zobellia roscoffensis TaxID=2779508 RepID=UPI00188B75FD|nr:MSMEG_0567/Sll0786 family nitrogen starvation N-acetyltransferase [Zobellia roscoffensis]